MLLDAPAAFSAVWSSVSGFLSDITKAKITFAASAELRAALAPWAGEELTAWLEAETGENRALAAAGRAGEKRYWEAPVGGAAHDPRGLPAFVASPHFFSPRLWVAAEGAEAAAGQRGSWLGGLLGAS